MLRIFVVLLGLLTGTTALSVDAPMTWAKAYWDYSEQFPLPMVLTRHSSGNFTVLSSDNVFLVSQDGGIVQQTKIQIPNYYPGLRTIASTREGGFILIGSNDFVYDSVSRIAKLDPKGVPVWEQTYSGLDSFFEARDIQQTRDGGYIVSGYSYPFIPARPQNLPRNSFDQYSKGWLMKLGGHGGQQWKRYYKLNSASQVR